MWIMHAKLPHNPCSLMSNRRHGRTNFFRSNNRIAPSVPEPASDFYTVQMEEDFEEQEAFSMERSAARFRMYMRQMYDIMFEMRLRSIMQRGI